MLKKGRTFAAETTKRHIGHEASSVWDGGEAVAIKIGNVVKKYIVDASGALIPDGSTTPFCRTDKTPIEYTAWYPYSDKEPTELTITDDQSTKEKREQRNLMKASGTAVNGQTAIQLQFSHEAARIQLCLTDTAICSTAAPHSRKPQNFRQRH